MAGNWLATLFEFLAKFWPLAIVEQWEQGVFYIFGRAMRWKLGPGLYPFIPWFMQIRTVNMVPAPVGTPLLNVTLSDSRTLGYSVTAVVVVRDAWHALNSIDDYQESTSEIIASKVSEKVAEVDAVRLDSEKRKRLLADLLRWVNEDTQAFGVEVLALRFTNFAIDQRAYRLLTDTALASIAW